MRYFEILKENSNFFIDIEQEFKKQAWDTLMNNLDQNPTELENYMMDYEDDEDCEINITFEQEMERGGALNDPDFAAWLKEKIEEKAVGVAHEFMSMVKNGNIRAYRAVEAPAGWVPDSGQNHPGTYWSRDPRKAIAHFGGSDPSHETYIIEADIPLSSINWSATISANLSEEFGVEEDEITIDEHAPIHIIKVKSKKPKPIKTPSKKMAQTPK